MNLPKPAPGDAGFALLVDADSGDPKAVEVLVEQLAQRGPVSIRRLYGNLHGSNAGKSWEALARLKGFERKHRPYATGTKNGADIALAVDAMLLLAEGRRSFCLVAGDTDFGPLVEQLHRAHAVTVIVSPKSTLHAWSQHSYSVKQVLAAGKTATRPSKEKAVEVPPKTPSRPATTQAKSPKVAASTRPVPPQDDPLEQLIRKALRLAIPDSKGQDWVDTDRLGQLLRKVDPAYTRQKYGLSKSATVASIARRFPQSFEVQVRGPDGNRRTFVRIRLD